MTEQVRKIASSSRLSGRNTHACVVRDLDHGYGARLEFVGFARAREQDHFSYRALALQDGEYVRATAQLCRTAYGDLAISVGPTRKEFAVL